MISSLHPFVLLQMPLLSFVLWLRIIPLYIYVSYFLYPFINQWAFWLFPALAILNSAVVNIEVHVSFPATVFSCYSSACVASSQVWHLESGSLRAFSPTSMKSLLINCLLWVFPWPPYLKDSSPLSPLAPSLFISHPKSYHLLKCKFHNRSFMHWFFLLH